jgi:hypothetical protein
MQKDGEGKAEKLTDLKKTTETWQATRFYCYASPAD